jgi:hypothetical protein
VLIKDTKPFNTIIKLFTKDELYNNDYLTDEYIFDFDL